MAANVNLTAVPWPVPSGTDLTVSINGWEGVQTVQFEQWNGSDWYVEDGDDSLPNISERVITANGDNIKLRAKGKTGNGDWTDYTEISVPVGDNNSFATYAAMLRPLPVLNDAMFTVLFAGQYPSGGGSPQGPLYAGQFQYWKGYWQTFMFPTDISVSRPENNGGSGFGTELHANAVNGVVKTRARIVDHRTSFSTPWAEQDISLSENSLPVLTGFHVQLNEKHEYTDNYGDLFHVYMFGFSMDSPYDAGNIGKAVLYENWASSYFETGTFFQGNPGSDKVIWGLGIIDGVHNAFLEKGKVLFRAVLFDTDTQEWLGFADYTVRLDGQSGDLNVLVYKNGAEVYTKEVVNVLNNYNISYLGTTDAQQGTQDDSTWQGILDTDGGALAKELYGCNEPRVGYTIKDGDGRDWRYVLDTPTPPQPPAEKSLVWIKTTKQDNDNVTVDGQGVVGCTTTYVIKLFATGINSGSYQLGDVKESVGVFLANYDPWYYRKLIVYPQIVDGWNAECAITDSRSGWQHALTPSNNGQIQLKVTLPEDPPVVSTTIEINRREHELIGLTEVQGLHLQPIEGSDLINNPYGINTILCAVEAEFIGCINPSVEWFRMNNGSWVSIGIRSWENINGFYNVCLLRGDAIPNDGCWLESGDYTFKAHGKYVLHDGSTSEKESSSITVNIPSFTD